MSTLTNIFDRLTDITSLRTQVTDLTAQMREMRNALLDQQKDVAEVRGQLKALIQIQGQPQRK